MKIEQIHHVAYRCKDAKETVEWYKKNLNMDYTLAFAENFVPSTHEPDPYMHIFLDAGNGNVLAFFELPTKPEMGRDENTPIWVQHLALKVKDRDTLVEYKEHLEANGVEVLGVTESRISQLRSEALIMLREGIEAQYDGTVQSPDEVKGRVARRKAKYATAISEASSWKDRVVDLPSHETLEVDVRS